MTQGPAIRRLSRALNMAERDGGWKTCCAKCGHELGPADTSWKHFATVSEVPMQAAGGKAYTSGEQVLLRRFCCPSCGALLDTETALPDDPFLEDVVRPEAG